MDTISLGRKYNRYYARKAARDLCSIPKTKTRPDFEFGEDDESWTGPSPRNPKRRLIHIGLNGFDRFPDGTAVCENENEWHCNIRHVLTHEEGHVFHTTERAWEMVQQNGIKDIISYCYEKKTGVRLYARNEEQYNDAVQELFMKHGLLINMDMVQKLVHMVANSIEDGRMERRMAASRPGFLSDLRACRGKRWIHSPVAASPDDAPDFSSPSELLIVVCNQILSFATMGIWQRGYMDYIAGTQAEDEVKKILPEIRAGVMARSCRSGMAHAGNIIRALCPLFYEACTVKDFPKELGEFLSQLAGALPDLAKDGNDRTSYNADESSEEQKDDDPGKGDYQLSDEQDSSSETVVVFNIFSDDQNGEESDESEESGNKAGASDAEEKSAGSQASGQQGAGNMNTASEGTGQNASEEDDALSSEESEDGQDGAEHGKKTEKHFTNGGASGSKGQSAKGYRDGDLEAVEKAMKDAVTQADAESGYAKQAVKHQEGAQKKAVYDNRSVLEDVDISGLCSDFHEFFRAYQLTEELPVSIEQEALVTRREYERYFRSLRKPTRRGQRAGRLDPRSLTRIVTKNIDVFTQPGEDHSFSGCIEILVDRSGSMSGWKMEQAMEICAMLEEIFTGLLPLKITAFDESGGVNFEVIKNWNDTLPRNGCWNFLKYGRNGGGTPTSEALMITEKEILARAEKHKLIILITDENNYWASGNLKNAIRHVRSSGVQLSAFYIESSLTEHDVQSFKELFDNTDAMATLPEHLSEEMLPVIRKFTHQK